MCLIVKNVCEKSILKVMHAVEIDISSVYKFMHGFLHFKSDRHKVNFLLCLEIMQISSREAS